jgi:hypothetical protein
MKVFALTLFNNNADFLPVINLARIAVPVIDTVWKSTNDG